MNTVFLILLLIAATIVANAIYTRFKLFPVAFLQIAAGLILSLFPIYRHFELEPEIFMLVIISMLMFNDGQNTNIIKLARHFRTTFSLAVELAIVSILIIGAVTHLLIPSLSLALAFALGAIIVPTDPVAVSSITSKVLVPKSVMGTLENESLFNDASGIVALNLAIAAIVTGKFSIWHGIGYFLYVFFGGIIIGAILGSIIITVRLRFIRHHVNTPSVMVPYTLMTPFVVYLIAEAVGVSGILAVVVTGLLHGVQQDRLRLTSSRLQIVMTSTWQIFSSILNGIVFVLLGLSLPRVVADLHNRDTGSVVILLSVGILLYLLMTLLRFFWVQLGFARIRFENSLHKVMNNLVTALSGVHGTITLSLAFSLPLTLNGHPFTYRNDLIFIAAVVILTSLIVPTIVLPLILPAKVIKYSPVELSSAKSEMVTNAIDNLNARYETSPTLSQVINILDGQQTIEKRADRTQLTNIFDHCFTIESDTINQMLEDKQISQKNADLYMQIAKKTIYQYQQNGGQRLIWFLKFRLSPRFSHSRRARKFRQFRRQINSKDPNHQQSHSVWEKVQRAEQKPYQVIIQYLNERSHDKNDLKISREELLKQTNSVWQKVQQVEQKPYHAVIKYLNESYNDKNAQEISIVRRAYDERHRRLNNQQNDGEQQNELLIEAFQYEYTFIQTQASANKYNSALSNALYEQISTDQLVYVQSVGTE